MRSMSSPRSRPPRQLRDEVSGTCDLHVQLQLLLEAWQRPEEGVPLGNDQDVDVDRALAPAEQDGGRATGEIHGCLGVGLLAELLQEAPDPVGIG